MFLPDGVQSQPPSGVADITPPDPETSAPDIALMQRVLSAASRNPNLIPADFMAYMLDWIQTQRLSIPIGQVFGFSQFTAQSQRISAAESTSSATFVALATAGPEINGLSDGKYLFLFGAAIGGGSGVMGLDVNGAGASDGEAAYNTGGTELTVSTAVPKTLSSGGSNSAVAVYRATSGTPTFNYRWLVALKYAN